jgi:hypothetical protein
VEPTWYAVGRQSRGIILRLSTAGRSGHVIVTDDVFVSDTVHEFGVNESSSADGEARPYNRPPPHKRVPSSDGVTICPEELRRGRPGEIPPQNQSIKDKETSLAHYINGNLLRNRSMIGICTVKTMAQQQ